MSVVKLLCLQSAVHDPWPFVNFKQGPGHPQALLVQNWNYSGVCQKQTDPNTNSGAQPTIGQAVKALKLIQLQTFWPKGCLFLFILIAYLSANRPFTSFEHYNIVSTDGWIIWHFWQSQSFVVSCNTHPHHWAHVVNSLHHLTWSWTNSLYFIWYNLFRALHNGRDSVPSLTL